MNVNHTGTNAPDDEEFSRAELNTLIKQNDPVPGHRFRGGERGISQFFHPPQDRGMRRALKRNLQEFLKNCAALGDRPKTRRRMEFECDEGLDGLDAMAIAWGAVFFQGGA